MSLPSQNSGISMTTLHMTAEPNNTVPIGVMITLTCHVDNFVVPVISVKWFHNDVNIYGYRPTHKEALDKYRKENPTPGSWRLIILSAQPEESGVWRCESNFSPSMKTASSQMELRIGVPRIMSISRDVETTISSTMSLYCNVSAEPDAVLVWSRVKPQRALPIGHTVHPISKVLRFVVSSVSDAGVYECIATNQLGNAVGRVKVSVIHAPIIDTELSESHATSWINIPVNLTCAWMAYPTPRVSWDRNGILVDQNRVQVVTRKDISLLQVTPTTTDFGVYRCIVANNIGRVEHIVSLSAAVTPGAPLNVRAGSTSHDTVILLIDSPRETGGLALTHFRVKYRNSAVLRWEVIDFPIGKNTIIVGLKPNLEYLFKVAAGNMVGFGNYSEVVGILTGSQYSPSKETTASTNSNNTGRDGTSTWPQHKDSGRDSSNTTDKPGVGSFGPSPFAIIIGVLVAVFLTGVVIFIMLSLYCVKWHKKRPTEEQRLCRNRPSSYIFSEASLFQLRQDSVQYDVMPNSPGLLRGEFEFPRDGLKLGSVLGTGSFGKVVRGEADGILRHGVNSVVAIKMLKENATPTDHQDLLKELGVMKILKPHPNIVTLFGCCTMEDPPLIIMEYLPNGNLLQHLRSSRQRIEDIQTQRASIRTALSPTDLIRYAYEIANGMTYLASMMCIHRDLAARNILLSRDGVCKLSDFGLARDVVNGGIYQRKTQGRVPIRWMALESLLDNVYTIQSDVWSFAVLLWEIVTIGSYPFPGMSSKKLIKELQRGYRMPRPDHCSGDVYDMMLDCWRENPEDRPTFENLRNRLEAILIESRNYLVLDFDEQLYDYTYTDSTDPIDV
ncbi:fibroblast growth factor receptor 2-like [Asterias rubens]|uniref:fibroblast growth factor receptor 2-like n=1 Tax=Asterias rubens TaxID=7604 RepID=UPI001455A8AB|nr:fibroblast growth factor receptor 2-like [Asterias rubens]